MCFRKFGYLLKCVYPCHLSTHEVYYLLNCIGYLYSDWSTSYLIRALVPHHSHLLLLLNHVVTVDKLCCVEGLIEDRCTSSKHSR